MDFDLAVSAHVLVGSAALLLYWIPLLAVKGSAPHKAAGRIFFAMLVVVAASVGPMLFLRPGAFDPGYVVQFAYLTLCLITVGMIGWTAIRWKSAPERFRGRHFRVLGPSIFALGVIVLAAGLAKGDPLPVVLSWVGLAYGGAMMRFAWMRAPLHPAWWLNWHLNATCGLFSAVHGTFLFVVWRWAVDPDAGRETAAAFQVAVLVAAIALRLWFGHARRVPLRFSKPEVEPLRMPARG